MRAVVPPFSVFHLLFHTAANGSMEYRNGWTWRPGEVVPSLHTRHFVDAPSRAASPVSSRGLGVASSNLAIPRNL